MKKMTLDKCVPIPPPLPPSYHPNRSMASRSSMREDCCLSSADRLFDEAYRADVTINTSNGFVIYAHSSILGVASPVIKAMLSKSTRRGSRRLAILMPGVPAEAVRVFIRYLYSSCYEESKMKEHALSLLVLSHSYMVPQLKRECEWVIEHGLINTENAVDIFQIALLCDAPRLSLITHRFIRKNLKPVCATEGWKAMKQSHPALEKQVLESLTYDNIMEKERLRKMDERKTYMNLYEAMEALVHICKEGCRTIGPYDKVLKADQEPCSYEACKGLEKLIRHFAGCKTRALGGCLRCKRMWQIFELHSRLCADPESCRVPLCKNFQLKRRQDKKDDITWRILVRKIVRSKSISGAPFFSLEST
nr:BTB/POZ and TAZ domain-containing protein 4-like [Ipomoea batatas]